MPVAPVERDPGRRAGPVVRLAYLDTSAAFKLIVEEAESASLAAELTQGDTRELASAWLLHTELHCAAARSPGDIPREAVQTVLRLVNLIDVTRGDLIAAGTQAALRANDSIHLTVALRLGVDEIITYDNELAAAAAQAGIEVLAPA